MNGGTRHFLATTALNEFWDASLPILFLGPWCKKFSCRGIWEKLDAETLPQPYGDGEAVRIFLYLQELHTRMLDDLACKLNLMHGVNYSARYWTIIAGPWLYYYLHSQYAKYLFIKSAFTRYPDLTTIVLDEADHVTPENTWDMVTLLKDDLYNLQLYGSMLKALGYRFPSRRISPPSADISSRNKHVQLSGFLKRFLKRALGKAFSILKDRASIILHNSYLPGKIQFLLAVKTRGKIIPAPIESGEFPAIAVNPAMRAAIGGLNLKDNEFEHIISRVIVNDLPKTIVENYSGMRIDVSGKYPAQPKAIFSSVSWYFDDMFKEWAARCAETGTVLIGNQHGGNYGSLSYLFQDGYELSILDRYYSWGWKRDTARCPVIPMTATKMMGIKNSSKAGQESGLFYVTNGGLWHYILPFPMTSDYLEAYMKSQMVFLSSLSREARAMLKVRPHLEDRGFDTVQRFMSIDPDIRIDRWTDPFQTSLEQCALFICDHCFNSTTFMEALHIDKPCILFHPDYAADEVHPDARKYYDELKEVDVLFDNADDAARQVNEVYREPRKWWNDVRRREVVARFKANYLRPSENAVCEWTREFENILSETAKPVK